MHKRTLVKTLPILALIIGAMAMVVASASARGGKADVDRDGASKRCEVKAGTNPEVADTDGNGIVDGLEDSDGDGANNAAESKLRRHCGKANENFRVKRAKIKELADGKLTLSIGKRGGLLTADVSDSLKCRSHDTSSHKKKARRGKRGVKRGNTARRGKSRRKRSRARNRHRSHISTCTTADLTEGTRVTYAKVRKGNFVRINLAK